MTDSINKSDSLHDVRLFPHDMNLLRQAIMLSEQSRREGFHPFTSIVADEKGEIILTARNNSIPPGGDPTQHAELTAAARAAKILTPEQLVKCTLYSSAEPCCMCAGAIYWCGIGRVVYDLSERRLLSLTGDHRENPTLSLPCREVLNAGQRHIEVAGPLLQDEASQPHIGFWDIGEKIDAA